MIRFLAPALLLLLLACTQQPKPSTAEKTAHVWGNCEQCKATIDKAAQVDGVEKANWNEDSKMLTVRLDTLSSSMDAVLKSIAAAGYDNELYRGSDEAYANLPECCHYERRP